MIALTELRMLKSFNFKLVHSTQIRIGKTTQKMLSNEINFIVKLIL